MDTTHKPLSIFWIYDGDLSSALDCSTWLSTTKALREMGCEVTLANIGAPKVTSIEGVEVLSLPTVPVYFFKKFIYHLKVIRQIIKKWDSTDVVLFHPTSGLFILPLLCRRNREGNPGPLFVVDVRTVHMASEGENNWRMVLRKNYSRLIQSAVNRWADGQTAITQRLADLLEIPKDKLWGIWQSGVDLEPFEPCLSGHPWELLPESVHLIYIGTLDDGRNVGVFCQAVIQQAQAGHAFTLTIVGNGFERPNIEKMARDNPQVIRFHPPVPHSEIPCWLAEAHAGILPFPDLAKFQVSSFIKLFEYQAAGLPLLATRIVSHTDFLVDCDHVFWATESSVAAFVKTLEEVWENRLRLPTLSKHAVLSAQSWTWYEAARKLKTALEFGLDQKRSLSLLQEENNPQEA